MADNNEKSLSSISFSSNSKASPTAKKRSRRTSSRMSWDYALFPFLGILGLTFGLWLVAAERYWLAFSWFALVFLLLGGGLIVYLSFKIVNFATPLVLRVLTTVAMVVTPIARLLSRVPVIAEISGWFLRILFFIWFILLLTGDAMVRAVLKRFVGHHAPTGRPFSLVNACDTRFQPLGLFDDSKAALEDEEIANEFAEAARLARLEGSHLVPRMPFYSRTIAFTLAMLSKLSYEDLPVIKYELERHGGFDMSTLKPIAYKNTCGIIVEKGDDIVLVFRGSQPLNLQHLSTDLQHRLKPLVSPYHGQMGRVHGGFDQALGEPPDPSKVTPRSSTLNIELSNTSLQRTIKTALRATVQLIEFVIVSVLRHVREPVDHRFLGTEVPWESAYAQAENWILNLVERDYPGATELLHDNSSSDDESTGGVILGNGNHAYYRPRRGSIRFDRRRGRKRLYITGHSLGGGLASVFVAKMVQYNSPLLDIFEGLYTYGQPKIGDFEHSRIFGRALTSKFFHHVHNNDVVARVPAWWSYAIPPGTLVFIDSARNITLYPPDPITDEPVSPRGISYLHPSGLLNHHILLRMPQESWLRLAERLVFPFFFNDHLPCEYVEALRVGQLRWQLSSKIKVGGREDEGGRTIPVYTSDGEKLK
ncbi:uncharacterized protein VTP21DRAFT_4893 [Calcarisporiella thermophila]|uniref:uncharacterized protein n=1 Tax=Calcarisporiella thermophila TaxID=911321 RepID=UPI003742E732